MAWKEELIPATFRAIPFWISSISTSFGRRNQVNEYPFEDVPNTEDMGRKVKKFTVNAYVIGDEYILTRDALVRAVEDVNTPGEFSHPTMGIFLVLPTDECEVVFDNKRGGTETFKLVFVESGLNLFPSITNDATLQAAIAAAEAALSIYEDFKSRLQTGDYPSFIGDNATSQVSDGIDLFNLASETGVSSGAGYSSFKKNSTDLQEDISTKITDPAFVGTAIQNLSQGLSDMYASPNDAYLAQRKLLSYGNDYMPVQPITPTMQLINDNQSTIANLFQGFAISQMVLMATRMTFDSRQAAINVRNEISNFIDQKLFQLGDQGNNSQYGTLLEMRARIVEDLTAKSKTLKNIVYVETKDSIPSVVFAYNQYGDADKDNDLIKRNNIANPLFLPPYTSLEVLK